MTARVRKQMSSGNEGKTCDAVVRCIERRVGETRATVRHPETYGIGPPVDFCVRLGAWEYAIEHTQIEAIPGLIKTNEEYMQLVKPIIDKVSGTLPGPTVYLLLLPIDTRLGVKRTDLCRNRQRLIVWIWKKAQCLFERNRVKLAREQASPRYLDCVEATPPGFPFPVRLSIQVARSVSEHGTLKVACLSPDKEKLEIRRTVRLRETLHRKCPKLQRCKEKFGARTVLVLESDDMALTNDELVGECLAALLPKCADPPDEIYLVETESQYWWVSCMKFDADCWPVQCLIEPVTFQMEDLIDLREPTTM